MTFYNLKLYIYVLKMNMLDQLIDKFAQSITVADLSNVQSQTI